MTRLYRYGLAAMIIALASSCSTSGPAVRPGEESTASMGSAAAAGALLGAVESRRIPARKPKALLALASPTLLGQAIDMTVLDGAGYPAWRAKRGSDLVDVQPVALRFLARLPEGGTELQSGMLYLPAPHYDRGTGGGSPDRGKADQDAPRGYAPLGDAPAAADMDDRHGDAPRASDPLTWVVFLKGTEHLSDNVPSRGGGSERTLMEAVAALGYAVWAPDYAGMGDATGRQEYCVPESMAASALDGLAAARSYLQALPGGFSETGRLVVLGYSQGGLAAMSALAAAADGVIAAPGLTVTAGYPLGAPLDLMAGVPFLKEDSAVITRPDYNLLLVLGWSRAYPEIVKPEEILLSRTIDEILPLYDGRRDGKELLRLIAKTVGKKPDSVLDSDLYLPSYLRAIRDDPGSVPYYRAQNGARLDRWTPPAGFPIVLAATPSDEVVHFRNTESAYSWIRETRPEADVRLVRLESGSHGRAAVEGLLYAIVDFDTRERSLGR